MAKIYAKTYGIDHQETFTLVAKMNTIQVILSIAVNLDWSLLQFDVNNVFLRRELTNEVYMDPPHRYLIEEENFCMLKRALYG